ncbi:hypothetical protein GCM10008949_50440 [Deinococcus humi]|nr:hypothetical protein GCM10008949_50440 [Deinococcus humi]
MGSLLRLNPSRIEIDVLNSPRNSEALLSYWHEFMAGLRYKDNEAWLDWADQSEARLLEAHLQALLECAVTGTAEQATKCLRRALDLAPDHPKVLARWAAHQNAQSGPSEEELLRALESVTQQLWLSAQEGRGRQEAESEEDVRQHRSALLDSFGRKMPVAFVPRRPLEATEWSREVLSTYQLRDHAGAEWAARQLLKRYSKGLPAALALDVLANLAIDQGQYHRGRQYAERALTLVSEPTSEVAFTAAYSNVMMGLHGRATEIAHSALKTLPVHDSPAMLYGILARVNDATQHYKAARHWHELALQAAYEHDDPFVLPQVISFMLWHFNITGEPDRSLQLAHEGAAYGSPNFSLHLVNATGFSHLLKRDFETAYEALAPQREGANVTLSATSLTCSALALHRMGQQQEAEIALRTALELLPLTENGNVKYEWAAAALTLDPLQWETQAQQCVEGVVSSDPTVPQWYERLKALRLK